MRPCRRPAPEPAPRRAGRDRRRAGTGRPAAAGSWPAASPPAAPAAPRAAPAAARPAGDGLRRRDLLGLGLRGRLRAGSPASPPAAPRRAAEPPSQSLSSSVDGACGSSAGVSVSWVVVGAKLRRACDCCVVDAAPAPACRPDGRPGVSSSVTGRAQRDAPLVRLVARLRGLLGRRSARLSTPACSRATGPPGRSSPARWRRGSGRS